MFIQPITQENLKPETRLFFGPLTYVGGSLARIDTDGGYIADGRFHAVYPDFQGNIRAVACGGEIKQVNHYYPYGLPFAEGIKPDAQPYSSACRFAPAKNYGAKELITDANLNLYDFHARWQDPVVPGFSRLDQMLEKYYNISPYAYCAGNPIRFIDPTGMDVYEVDADGRFKLLEKNDDEFHTINANGSDQSIQVSLGFFDNAKSVSINFRSGGEDKGETENATISVYESDENLFPVFNFLVLNTDVEWSVVSLTQENGESTYKLGTTNEQTYDLSQSYIGETAPRYGQSVIEARHSHTGLSTGLSKADVKTAEKISDLFPNAIFSVVHMNCLDSPRYYDRNSTPHEYPGPTIYGSVIKKNN